MSVVARERGWRVSSTAAVHEAGRFGIRWRALSTEAVLLGAIVVAAAVIRILTIGNQSIWADEALTSYETQLPFGAMLHTVSQVETTPPLYFVVVWCWAKVFGTGAVALRSLSSIAGLALVPLSFLAGRELVSRRAGLLAAAFVAVNPLMVWYSQEARSYMLLAALTAAGFVYFMRAERAPTRRHVAWWAGLSSLALMTHFFAGFIVAPEALWLLWRRRNRLTLAASGAVALVQAAMLPFAFAATSRGTGWIHAIGRLNRISTLALEWGVGTNYRLASEAEGLIGLAVVVVLLALLLRFGGDRVARERLRPVIWIVAFVLVAPLLLGLFGQDYFLSRNAIPAFVPLAILLAAACVMPRARLVGAGLATALLAMFTIATVRVQTHGYLQRPPWQAVAQALGPASVPRAVFAAGEMTAQPLKIYLPNVSWVQNQSLPREIGEVDVVGTRRRYAVFGRPVRVHGSERVSLYSDEPVPRAINPPGAVLLSRFRVDNWVIARFRLDHPRMLTIRQLIAIAGDFFRHTPRSIFVFVQQPSSRTGPSASRASTRTPT